MILLFLRDLRSVIVVVSQHPARPARVAVRALGDGQHDQHHVAGRHGAGDRHPRRRGDGDRSRTSTCRWSSTPNIATAVLHASNATAVPRLLALLCILSVFIPAFIMERPAPVAVHAADPGRRVRHDLVVPALQHVRADHVRRPAQAHGAPRRGDAGCSTGSSGSTARSVDWFVRLRWLVVPVYLGGVRPDPLACWGCRSAPSCSRRSTRGEFVLRFRPPPGSNFELTRQMAVKCLEEIEREAKPENIEITMGFVGQVAPNFGIDNMVLFMRGPDDGQLRVALQRGQRDQARRVPRAAPQGPARAGDPLAGQAAGAGGPVRRRRRSGRPRLSTFGFEPGDIVTRS